ncbi:MAG TPA: extracellular solute-binding protein [Symbiobacteriaceae bacterium]|nr:extracellular solute-binding protein [Symbiobacteriaceae bacterium]
MKRTLPIVLILSMLLAVACQKGTPARTVQPQAATPEAIATIKLGYRSADAFAKTIDQLAAAFAQRYPQYRVEKVELPEPGTELDKQLKAGAVDIITSTSLVDPELASPLDPYLDRSGPQLKNLTKASDSLRIGGHLYQLPILLLPEGLLINRDLWQAAGLTPPANGWTWSELREAAAKLTRGEGADRVWGLNASMPEYLLEVYLMEKTGAPFWMAKEEDVLEALRLLAGMVLTDRSLPAPASRDWANSMGTPVSRLLEKKQAAIEYGTVLPAAIINERLRFPWDVAPMPVGSGQRPVMRVVPTSLAMVAGTAQSDGARAFMQFAAGAEGAAIVAATGAIPADGTAVTGESRAAMQSAAPAGTLHLLDTLWVHTPLLGENAHKVAQELRRLTNLCLRGELDADTAVTQFVQFRKQWITD